MKTAYYQLKARVPRISEDDLKRTQTEQYVTRAVNFSDAEKQLSDYLITQGCTEFDITHIARMKLHEVHQGNSIDKWFLSRIALKTLSETTGREKSEPYHMLVQAATMNEAKAIAEQQLRSTMMDFTIEKIEETKTLEVLHLLHQ